MTWTGWLKAAGFAATLAPRGPAAVAPTTIVHGLWVWKSAAVLGVPGGAERLRDFCGSNHITEVYVAVPSHANAGEDQDLVRLIHLLHAAGVRVEALLSSVDADEPGRPREKFIAHARTIVEFNARHGADRFDGLHLDIEPQQRPENKGQGNLRFVGDLVETYQAVRSVADAARMTVNADIQNKLLKGDLAERRLLLAALPRITLMLYELSSPTDGTSPEQQEEKLRKASAEYLAMAYQGLDAEGFASMVIGLRTPDYGSRLPEMLEVLDRDNGANAHYVGWARHSYNDYLNGGG
jgi:hypothetical protein